MKKTCFILLVIIIVASAPAFSSPLEKGNFGVTFPALTINSIAWFGEWSDYNSFSDNGSITLKATEGFMSLGYFPIHSFEIGPYIYIQNVMSSGTTTIDFGAFTNFYIELERNIPFFGFRFWWDNISEGEHNAFIFNPSVGYMAKVPGSKLYPYTSVSLYFYKFPDTEFYEYEGMYAVMDIDLGLKFFF